MTQTTRVYRLSASAAARLETDLQAGLVAAEWRSVPHARFSVKGEGVVVTCYNSGKLVVQGSDVEAFAARFLRDAAATPASTAAAADPDPVRSGAALIGSDETGKGDYFGPLVVAATYVGVDDVEWVAALGVTDSKRLTDTRMQRLVGELEARLDHQIVALAPPEYNVAYAATPNVNTLLADLHARALAPLIERHPGVDVLVDRFAKNDAVVQTALQRYLPGAPRVRQRPRAESELAVAAASILARVRFLEGLRACSDDCGTDLAKGAGQPVDAAARRVHEVGGMDLLARVAKMHFRNTQKIPGVR